MALFYAKRAAAYTSLKKLGQALRDLDAALEVDGNYTTGYLHRGKLHRWGKAGGGGGVQQAGGEGCLRWTQLP